MADFFASVGYPDRRALRRPVLWTLGSMFVALADALPTYTTGTFGTRLFHAVGLLVIGGNTAASWRKNRQKPVEPLGRVQWPVPKQQ